MAATPPGSTENQNEMRTSAILPVKYMSQFRSVFCIKTSENPHHRHRSFCRPCTILSCYYITCINLCITHASRTFLLVCPMHIHQFSKGVCVVTFKCCQTLMAQRLHKMQISIISRSFCRLFISCSRKISDAAREYPVKNNN